MKDKFILVACLTVLAACAEEAPVTGLTDDQVISQLQERALGDATAWELLASLTTDVGHRMAGTEGDRKAVEWAVQKMTEMGFDRVWTEPVEFPWWVRTGESGRVHAGEGFDLDLVALGGTPGTGGDLTAEVVQFESLAALEEAEAGSLEGRIAYIGSRMEKVGSGAGYGVAVAKRSRGPYIAAARGASALLIRSAGTDVENSAPHTGNISGSEPGDRLPAAALSNESADRFEAALASGAPIEVTLNLDVGFQGTASSSNVIGEFDGSGDTGKFVLVGGHLDSWDQGTGAHDDGAGVVTSMTAAWLVASQEQRPKHGIRVVLFANEEQGIFGGKQYASAHAGELDRHIIGAEADLGAGKIYQFRTRVNEAAAPQVKQLESWLSKLGIPFSGDRPASGGADIGQMRAIGLPVIDLNHDASRYFDLHHTRNDVLENVDPESLRFNVAAYVTFIQWAANGEGSFGPIEIAQ